MKPPEGEKDMRNRTGQSMMEHRKLTNDELYRLICSRIPHMAFLNVTDEIRETVIAMIEVSELKV